MFMHPVCRTVSLCKTQTPHPFTAFPRAPAQPLALNCTFCFYEFAYLGHLRLMESRNIGELVHFHLFFFWSFVFLGPHLRYMVVPRLGVELELQLLACTTTTATLDPSQVCDLHHSSRQCQIFNPLREARDWTHNLMVPSWICFCCATMGTPTQTSCYLSSKALKLKKDTTQDL